MRGVANERETAETPTRDRIAVYVRQLQHALGRRRREQAAHIEPGVSPAFVPREAGVFVGSGVPGLERRRAWWDLGVREPVDHHLAAGLPLDRIEDSAVVAMADDGHRGASEIRHGLDNATVMQIAVEHRLLARI